MTEKKFLTTKELSQRWGVSDNTLRKWRAAGRPPASFKIGKNVRYNLDDIIQFEKLNKS